MKDDVFNLKVGKEVYHVDYNNKTGKFTELKQIEPANNLIVCGLHAIYDNNINFVYNVKIFMDPQKELKHKWKIIRDVKERGYNINNVIESIKIRELDYNRYILPQKSNVDIVVNFFSKNTVDIYDLEKEDEISLRLILNKKLNLDKIKNFLYENNIKFSMVNSGISAEFIFDEFKALPNLPNQENSFYDYICFVIFHI